jgi:two-component system phosphate regulon sensor histidine kinase PhoR
MTHEFKTPISTIAVSTEVLKEPNIVNQPERLLNYASIIEKENVRLKNQVERVLQMARLDKEDVDLKKEKACVHDLLEEAIGNSHVMLVEKQGVITTSWQALKSEIMADRLHLTNVFTNMIDNAIKYCSVSPAISIQTENHSNGIIIEIRDNGIGISAENQRRIFQKFFRVSTGNVHDVKGFGLGLSYVKRMVESHGGNVQVRSTPGNGSAFSIFFPI